MNVDRTRLRQLRVEAGLGVRDLAALAHVSPAMLSMVENGGRSPSPPMLARLAEALGVPTCQLIKETST